MSAPRPLALITGASSGIGEQLARQLALRGHDLLLVARRQERLQALCRELAQAHGVEATAWPEDLTDPAAPQRLEAKVLRTERALAVLVNNAGTGVAGPFAASDGAEEARMVTLNVLALHQLTRRLLPFLLANGSAHILNVASTAGLQPVPMMATYAATKAFVLSFSQALDEELAGSGVTVTALCPGPTQTEFIAAAKAEGTRLFHPSKLASAEAVAKAGLEGMDARRPVVIPGARNCFVSRRALVRISGKLMSPA